MTTSKLQCFNTCPTCSNIHKLDIEELEPMIRNTANSAMICGKCGHAHNLPTRHVSSKDKMTTKTIDNFLSGKTIVKAWEQPNGNWLIRLNDRTELYVNDGFLRIDDEKETILKTHEFESR